MNGYRVCQRCVMDTTAKNITFDENGYCKFCSDFLKRADTSLLSPINLVGQKDYFIEKVKAQGKRKEYDCIVGISGGVDSSYALLLAVENGLRPLAVHLDNGWNSELAAQNMSNLVDKLGVDRYTHIIDWEENRDLQRSFFKANVVDIELLMDNAMLALNYQQAARFGLKYILSGDNQATEGLAIPEGWNHYKLDATNVRRIQKKFGNKRIQTHLLLSTMGTVNYRIIKKINRVPFLDYFPYNKSEAIDLLKREVGYQPYPYKHYESVFTRFYQGYILPKKFGYDKRRPHLSNLVVSGQMSREEALELLKESPYPDSRQEEQDRIYVMTKLGFTEESFQNYMAAPEIAHEIYGSEKWLSDFLSWLAGVLGRK